MDVTERQSIEDTEKPQETAPDAFAEKAKAAGWRPLEEFEGDPEHWVDAKEFVRRAPLYEKNHKLKREVTELKTAMHELKGHIGKVSEAAYKKAVADLESRRDEAIDLGDRAAVKEIDKEIKAAEALKTTADETHPAIAAWEKDNGEWFYKDPEIADFGLAHFQNYCKRNPNDISGGLEAMERAVKKAYPEKFEKANPKRKDPPPVEPGGSQGKRSFGKADLTDEQRKVGQKFERMGIMTMDDYIKDLAESGVLGGKQ
jgi:hypothetical protein